VGEVARRHGKVAAIMATDAAWMARARSMGYTLLAAGTDSGLLQAAMGDLIRQAR
jgi:2-keto-3-deoxy-L-rhamnonate aldolase RhmA